MKKEILEFIKESELLPFNEKEDKSHEESAYKTRDAKAIHTKLLNKITSGFHFNNTKNIIGFFEFTENVGLINKRQEFFKGLKRIDGTFLEKISAPKKTWKQNYSIIVVTEDEKTFNELQKLGCPTKFIITQNDLSDLEDYDIVQVIDCENFSRAFESLPQAVFLDDLNEVYLERYVQLLSAWKSNVEILKANEAIDEVKIIADEVSQLFPLLETKSSEVLTRDQVTESLSKINNEISQELKKLTFAGDSLFEMLSKNSLPDELKAVVKKAIATHGITDGLYIKTVPASIDEDELEKMLRKQDNEKHTTSAEKIKKNSELLRKLPGKFKELEVLISFLDFISGINPFLEGNYPVIDSELEVVDSLNLLIEKAQPISFKLDDKNRCSILTGANSGGKTTLLEHIIQINSLLQIGLPVIGKVKTPIFTDIYYFAKNKGSSNKGAFETLLTQMSKINPGKKTLILADEIESVTEPGVAGVVVAASADFFIRKGCFLIIATHLGKEIQKKLPENARIDGIEAKGLDEYYELIVDHNPVLGRLANSTPELIIEKMANSFKTDYFNYLHNFIKNDKKS